MIKTLISFALALALGAACRWIEIPVPAPNRLIGALLVLAVTLGYVATDALMGDPSVDASAAVEGSEDVKPEQ